MTGGLLRLLPTTNRTAYAANSINFYACREGECLSQQVLEILIWTCSHKPEHGWLEIICNSDICAKPKIVSVGEGDKWCWQLGICVILHWQSRRVSALQERIVQFISSSWFSTLLGILYYSHYARVSCFVVILKALAIMNVESLHCRLPSPPLPLSPLPKRLIAFPACNFCI